MYIKFFFALILFINSIFGMQQPEDSSMTKINSWQDMEQFAGKVIAFQSNSHHICYGGYKIENDSSILFGWVSEIPQSWAMPCHIGLASVKQQGYGLAKILKQDALGCTCALIDFYLSEGLWVRRITQEEFEKINNAVKNKQARLN